MTKPAPSASLLDDLAKGRWDIAFFAERFLAIECHAGQRAFFDAIITRRLIAPNDVWRPAYLTICCSAGNRAGKTLAMAIAIFHACVYKINQRPPDYTDDNSVRAWMRAPYDWYHFGIQQEVAELVFRELTKIFESRHEAQQGRVCPLIEELGPQVVEYQRKERGEYVWVVLSEVLGGAEIHFRTTTERALGTLGKAMHGVSMDECGFENNLPFIINEVFHMRRLSTGGQLFLISTPSEGFTAFTDEWNKGDPDNPLRVNSHYSLRMSTRDNVDYGIDPTVFDTLVSSMPPELIPQNIDGYFLQGSRSFFNSAAVDHVFVQADDETLMPYLPERQIATPNHRYIHGIDPALTYDNTYSIVIDITDRSHMVGSSIKRLTGKQTTISVVGLAHDQHSSFSANGATCVTGVDVTGFGGKMMRDALSGIPGLRGVEFGGNARVKMKLLMDLKAVIEQGKIRFPKRGHWLDLRRQLLAYRIADRKIEQDAVMALAIAVKLALRYPEGKASASMPFSYFVPPEARAKTNEEKFWRSLKRRGTVQSMRIG